MHNNDFFFPNIFFFISRILTRDPRPLVKLFHLLQEKNDPRSTPCNWQEPISGLK